MPVLQVCHQVLRRHFGLAQEACKSADLQLCVKWNNTTLAPATHDNVAATLSSVLEPKALQGANHCSPRNAGQFSL